MTYSGLRRIFPRISSFREQWRCAEIERAEAEEVFSAGADARCAIDGGEVRREMDRNDFGRARAPDSLRVGAKVLGSINAKVHESKRVFF